MTTDDECSASSSLTLIVDLNVCKGENCENCSSLFVNVVISVCNSGMCSSINNSICNLGNHNDYLMCQIVHLYLVILFITCNYKVVISVYSNNVVLLVQVVDKH